MTTSDNLMPDIQTVHVIFKTHLDVGFTDYAAAVVARYFNEFMPQAVKLARQIDAQNPENPFRWTVGSWLVYEYLEKANADQRRDMEKAIADGHLNWHALPFTTHTEFMDADLFRYGLSLSAQLDERFGRKTVAGKMTDVPGHTRAMIPLMVNAGVRFLHIGVNPAASVPDVPPVFIWRDPDSNTEIYCMYQQVYGDSIRIPGTDEAVSLIFTGDNHGPPSLASVNETYVGLRQQFPNATFKGATLDVVVHALDRAKPDLPVITSEIGDTWIQGVGTDPTKTRHYRELLRLRQNWRWNGQIEPDRLDALEAELIMIPEHTWGMDLKTHLDDYTHYSTAQLASARKTDKFKAFEASWTEQRGYVDSALATLAGSPLAETAQSALTMTEPRRPNLSDYAPADRQFDTGTWRGQIGANGALIALTHTPSGKVWADNSHMIGAFRYETFSTADYDRYWRQYIRDREFGEIRIWAHPDNTKPELEVATHGLWEAECRQVLQRTDDAGLHLLCELAFPPESHTIGAPATVWLEYTIADDTLHIDLQWFDKPACRLPEAFWMAFNPSVTKPSAWEIEKLGRWISPLDVISRGGRTLHAFDRGIRYDDGEQALMIQSLDAGLVAPGRPSLIDFHDQLPDLAGGMHFNLYNNVWGTNFTMWFEDDARFRWVLSL